MRAADPGFVERDKSLAEAPGRRYFQEKQLRTDLRKQARCMARDEAGRAHEELTCWAAAVRPLRLLAPIAGGRDCLINSSLLVPRNRAADFHACLDRLNAEHAELGVTLELSGPWPPYSFSPSLPRGSEPTDEMSGLLHSS